MGIRCDHKDLHKEVERKTKKGGDVMTLPWLSVRLREVKQAS